MFLLSAESYEQDNKHTGSIKGGKTLDWLGHSYLPKKKLLREITACCCRMHLSTFGTGLSIALINSRSFDFDYLTL
jgi:hypothetical protein